MDIERLASLESSVGALVSVYLDPAAGPASTVLGELLKPVKAAAEMADHETAMSIRADVARLSEMSSRFDTEPAAGWFAFMSNHDRILEVSPVDVAVPNVAMVGKRPYLRPLRALSEPSTALVALVERPRVVLWRVDSDIAEITTIESELGKDNFGGFRGYDERKAAGFAEEESLRVWREAADAALEAHRDTPVDLVIVAGHRYDLNHFVEQLHPYLRKLPVMREVVDPRTVTPPQMRDLVRDAQPDVRRRQDEAAVQLVLEGAYSGQPVARGTSEVLKATNLGAVDRLVVSGPFAKDGGVCPECGWLERSADTCSSCGATVDEVNDVVAAAIETVLSRGGKVAQVGVASALDTDGVAALLRFPI